MDTKLTSVFSKHIDEFNQPLDKYFTDWYIKDFLEKYCGYASFTDIPDNLKKAAFRYWPRVPLPEWDDIVKEEFQELRCVLLYGWCGCGTVECMAAHL